ncbi:hypothetical protein [Nocardioides convexus]|nr:hypothetical protein [Nocardioides convexus]
MTETTVDRRGPSWERVRKAADKAHHPAPAGRLPDPDQPAVELA